MRAPIRCELLVMHAVYGPAGKKTINNDKSLSLLGVVKGDIEILRQQWKGAF